MGLDAWIAAALLAAVMAIFLGFLALAWRAGLPRYERVERQQVRSPLLKRIFEAAYWTCLPLARGLSALGLSADAISGLALANALLAGAAFAVGHWGVGALFYFFSGMLDVIDGMVAKLAPARRPGGAVVDSSVDRYADFAVLCGIALYFRDSPHTLFAALLTIHGSSMVSYSSAKAEALQLDPPRGLMKRTERGPLLVLAAVLSALSVPLFELPASQGPRGVPMIAALWLLGVLSNVSAVRRLLALHRAAESRDVH